MKPSFRRRRFIFFAATVLAVLALAVCVGVSLGKINVILPEGSRISDWCPESDLVALEAVPGSERQMTVRRNGSGTGSVFIERTEGGSGFLYVRVLPGGMIYDKLNGNFSGCRGVTAVLAVYAAILAVLAILSFIDRCRSDFFSYMTLYLGGAMLFLTGLAADLALCAERLFRYPRTYFMLSVYGALKGAGGGFLLYTAPFMLIVAVSLFVSNFFLIRREGRRFVNLLGLLLGGLILCGYAGYYALDRWLSMGSEWEIRIYGTVTSVYTTVFAYFESMLISAMLCGLIAVMKKPGGDRTHVIILGCGITPEGMPRPLLRGRIERAIRFAREQREKTGIPVRFVPSGGKGADEVISEAEAMERYLLAAGIPAEDILREDRSANTRENMRFSLAKIRGDCPDPHIVFSTSGYHVLRSGMVSREEGLDAEGIGSRTKWYFWPNAFVREFIGLLAAERKRHFFWILFFIAVIAAINMIMPM